VPPTAPLRRQRDNGDQRASSVELFFDLVYVFAVTQLSHRLLAHLSAVGALETAVLLAMVWLVWVYTTWVTNYLDPSRQPIRVMLARPHAGQPRDVGGGAAGVR
jgi:low temperature requirement protein LtrA